MRALAAGWLVVACGDDSSGPGGTLTATANDSIGDTFGAGATQLDLTALTITRDTGGIDIALDFTATVFSPVSGNANAVFGQVDFDVDQDTLTGLSSIVDFYRPPGSGSTAMGVDYFLDLFLYNADSTVDILDTLGAIMGQVRPVFNGSRISVRIRRGLFGGDDAFVNAAAIIGTNAEPTDIAPNNGHLQVGTGLVAPYQPTTALRRTTRTWGSPWAAPKR